MVFCHHCKGPLDLPRLVPRGETCPRCGRDVRCCLNCTFYDPYAQNQCREPIAEPVLEKDMANFCEFFSVADRNPEADEAATARRKLEELFRKK